MSDCQEAGIDLAFLEALPPELRAEVLSAHGAKVPEPAPAAAAAQPAAGAAAAPAEPADDASGAAGERLLVFLRNSDMLALYPSRLFPIPPSSALQCLWQLRMILNLLKLLCTTNLDLHSLLTSCQHILLQS